MALFGGFFVTLVVLIGYFQYHQHQLLSVAGGTCTGAAGAEAWDVARGLPVCSRVSEPTLLLPACVHPNG